MLQCIKMAACMMLINFAAPQLLLHDQANQSSKSTRAATTTQTYNFKLPSLIGQCQRCRQHCCTSDSLCRYRVTSTASTKCQHVICNKFIMKDMPHKGELAHPVNAYALSLPFYAILAQLNHDIFQHQPGCGLCLLLCPRPKLPCPLKKTS